MQQMPLEVHKTDGIIKANSVTQYAAECRNQNAHIFPIHTHTHAPQHTSEFEWTYMS